MAPLVGRVYAQASTTGADNIRATNMTMQHEAAAPLSDKPKSMSQGEVRPLSYAQNMEDYHLWLALSGKPFGTYIDVGGGHPIADSVSFWFYERGWRGVVVEPQDHLAALHRRLRPRDILVRAVIGRERDDVDFFVVQGMHALSSTVRQCAETAE